MADESSSHGGGAGRSYRSFRQVTRDRLLLEMLRSVQPGGDESDWKVLVLDDFTLKIMSSSCKMADITDEGISLVEDINKGRRPLPTLDAVYFVQPSNQSIKKIISDMSGRSPYYKRAFIFLSSPLPQDLLQLIKSDGDLLSRLAALKEINLEYMAVDAQGFVTNHERALEQLFGEHNEGTRDYELCIDSIALRLATVFASMKEFPLVRYKVAKTGIGDGASTVAPRTLVPTKLAAALWSRLMRYKSHLVDFPQTETCELVIVDRSMDLVAPVIHEWTYDAMCHDLLQMEGNKYMYEMSTSSGKMEHKEVLLEEHDPVWAELRHLHIADASLSLNEKMTQFGTKNKAAQIRLGAKPGQELSTRDMQKLVQALPQFRDQLDKLSLHIHIATELNDKIRQQQLSDTGKLEQDLVFGDATSKDLISIYTTHPNMSMESKLRLLLIYAATHPEKLDTTKRLQWMKLAKFDGEDMNAVNNLEFLGVSVTKKQSAGLTLKFGARKAKKPVRKEKTQDDESWQLSRFYPVVEDVIEELARAELSKIDYPFVKEPLMTTPSSPAKENLSSVTSRPAVSVRTTKSTWASKSRAMEDGASGDLSTKADTNNLKVMGKRIFIFVVGGMTRSELRTAHKMTKLLKREVVMGSTSLEDPGSFVQKLKSLSRLEEIDLN